MSDPHSGHYSPVEVTSDTAEFYEALVPLRGVGRGYVEVGLSDRDDVQLTMGFQEDYAVIHLIADAHTLLLVGDGIAPIDAMVEVPIMGELGQFTGEFAMGVDRAWTVIQNFLDSVAPESLGEWREL
ncbi:hypothetical protein KDL01_09445 [Actinospica durhamensis]|uniref:Uncharacterized protein n=1 Tax=Actinospica durhamensis TaxID=1508375 RepID=A0A941IN19_9ACTN|nr:hypothetical protein [Actinospica durhamensis]MBR7833489.1 hypothetical protein [Actinospica durhamensis]